MRPRVIYSNRFRFEPHKTYCGNVAFEGATPPTGSPNEEKNSNQNILASVPASAGYNSESIVMVLAACKFFFIISY